ncbi:helix-turn-helix domain-containing protein [Streptomyces scabiei]|uniref:helix-turn-helix domain-containing protein n=1 Tax=Streptomyces scabiei TaxID=1930 RepID=UPI0029A5B431|nr:helix-turn-helix transcriptional regulator [Streptomyces scabiei]MDX2531547.1 helix-turn-helix transcriptional regulator [Streptomyces scabiei]MDX2796605.1 helix-turn-helix transcriptional regulator [Streptomyces scabiei]MDX2856865.1 helix-turn-helix transcriptional regulator [Streptomyces scabiei]MDX3824607.1 helix-turn-helix transcriptional regulator [Streptomyces scabiei]
MPDPFGELMLRLRKDMGRTQEEQADAINAVSGRETVSRREISRYENSENVPTNHTLAHIAAASGVPVDELLRAAKAARARRRRGKFREEEDQDDVKRRQLLGSAVIGVSAAAEPWGRLAFALSKGSRIDTPAAVALINRAADLHVQELNLSARRLQRTVESHLDAITVALPHAGEHERALTIAAGETAALAGWVAWDLGEHDKADAYYDVTTECATKAGHPPLRALALTYASYGASRPKRKLELLSQASQDVRGHRNATAAAWVLGRQAEEAAAVGDEIGALRALDRASFAYDFADHTGEQAWVRFVTPYRMDSLALSVYGQLGRPELTATADTAIGRLGDELPDGGVVVLGDLASALLHGGDVEQGVYVSRQFTAASQAKPNTMGKERAAKIAARLPDSERELAHHLRQFAA